MQIDIGCSILEHLYKVYNYQSNSSALYLKTLLTLCLQDDTIMEYILNLPPPSFNHCTYYSFFKEFIKLFEDTCRTTSYSFPKTETFEALTKLYGEFERKRKELKRDVKEQHASNDQSMKTAAANTEQGSIVRVSATPVQTISKQFSFEETAKSTTPIDSLNNTPSKNADQMQNNQNAFEEWPSIQQTYGNWQDTVNDSGKKESVNIDERYEEGLINYTPAQDQNILTSDNYENYIDGGKNSSVENNANIKQEGDDWEDDENGFTYEEHESSAQGVIGQQQQWGQKQRGEEKQNYYFNAEEVSNQQFFTDGVNYGHGQELQVVGNKMKVYDMVEEEKRENYDERDSGRRRRRYDDEEKVEVIHQAETIQFAQGTEFVEFPIDFRFKETREHRQQGMIFRYHNSFVTMLRLPTDGVRPDIYGVTSVQKLLDRLPKDYIEKNKTLKFIEGIHVSNPTREYMRIKWKYGSVYIRPGDNGWIWDTSYERIFITDREYDWPKWVLFS